MADLAIGEQQQQQDVQMQIEERRQEGEDLEQYFATESIDPAKRGWDLPLSLIHI